MVDRNLRITLAKKSEHLSFNLHNFSFFRNSERGEAMPFFGGSRFLEALIEIPYILGSELAFFRGVRYFVRLSKPVVGVFVLRERSDALYISSVGVAPEYRRRGIASFILDYCREIAERLGKGYLELTVLKMNTPARRLYERSGFRRKEERKWSFVLRKNLVSERNPII